MKSEIFVFYKFHSSEVLFKIYLHEVHSEPNIWNPRVIKNPKSLRAIRQKRPRLEFTKSTHLMKGIIRATKVKQIERWCYIFFFILDSLFKMSQVLGSLGFAMYTAYGVSATLTFMWTKHWKKLKGIKLTAGITALAAGNIIWYLVSRR